VVEVAIDSFSETDAITVPGAPTNIIVSGLHSMTGMKTARDSQLTTINEPQLGGAIDNAEGIVYFK
jgi:hypothetical protein